jgi:hypothetical protein
VTRDPVWSREREAARERQPGPVSRLPTLRDRDGCVRIKRDWLVRLWRSAPPQWRWIRGDREAFGIGRTSASATWYRVLR